MTGFGTAEVQWETWSCISEIRAVNHRFLDINLRIPSSFQKMEQELKNHIKSLCSRGKIDCTIRLEKDSGGNEQGLKTEEAKNIIKLLCEFENLTGRSVNINLADMFLGKIFVEKRSEKIPDECEDIARKCLSNALTD